MLFEDQCRRQHWNRCHHHHHDFHILHYDIDHQPVEQCLPLPHGDQAGVGVQHQHFAHLDSNYDDDDDDDDNDDDDDECDDELCFLGDCQSEEDEDKSHNKDDGDDLNGINVDVNSDADCDADGANDDDECDIDNVDTN